MAKRNKIPLQHSEALESIDDELAEAMEQLDNANLRVGGLLQACEPQEPAPQTPPSEEPANTPEPASQDSADAPPPEEKPEP